MTAGAPDTKFTIKKKREGKIGIVVEEDSSDRLKADAKHFWKQFFSILQ